MNLGVQILQLRAEGKSYRQIEKALGCSKGTICYYCRDGQKEKIVNATTLLRRDRKKFLVEQKGGKCSKCGYNKSVSALEFHHSDPSSKTEDPSSLMRLPLAKILKEIEKCILVCANCHREIHDELNVRVV